MNGPDVKEHASGPFFFLASLFALRGHSEVSWQADYNIFTLLNRTNLDAVRSGHMAFQGIPLEEHYGNSN